MMLPRAQQLLHLQGCQQHCQLSRFLCCCTARHLPAAGLGLHGLALQALRHSQSCYCSHYFQDGRCLTQPQRVLPLLLIESLLLRLQSPTLLLVLFLPACDLPWLPAQV